MITGLAFLRLTGMSVFVTDSGLEYFVTQVSEEMIHTRAYQAM